MRITICGSMSFAKEMLEAQDFLEAKGHVCFLPEQVEEYASGLISNKGGSEGAQRKIENDLIRKHYNLIQDSDAILVLNYKKGDVDNYIGGNSFLEIGFAHILRKKIFLINPIPNINFIKQEIEAVQPIILDGDLGSIKFS
ncbi:MAG: hypothetical protein AAB738_03825 [Patescibacteria group bacterium]